MRTRCDRRRCARLRPEPYAPTPVRTRQKRSHLKGSALAAEYWSASCGHTKNRHSARQKLGAPGKGSSDGGTYKERGGTGRGRLLLSRGRAHNLPAVETETP